MSVLSQDWVNSFAIEEGAGAAIKEVALAWDRQGGQVQYDQSSTTSRRHTNVSPEDATAEETIYLDCSSYVNNIYREVFGENIMPFETTAYAPNTSNYNSFASPYKAYIDTFIYHLSILSSNPIFVACYIIRGKC
jgi:hypothetical protein